MTLDEQIAWVSERAAALLRSAVDSDEAGYTRLADRAREEAAAFTTIENSLRRLKALADEASGELA